MRWRRASQLTLLIGYVTKQENGGFKGRLATLTIQLKIEIAPNEAKKAAKAALLRQLMQARPVPPLP
jgi:uncharacterized protein (DUF736 family)